MAKKKQRKTDVSCGVKKVQLFRKGGKRPFLRDGKPVIFRARPGGPDNCGKVKPTAGQKRQRKLFSKAAAACRAQKGAKKTMFGKKLASCVTNVLKRGPE